MAKHWFSETCKASREPTRSRIKSTFAKQLRLGFTVGVPPRTMKNQVSPHSVAFLILGLMAPLSAQNLPGNPSLFSRIFKPGAAHVEATAPGSYEVPPVEKVRGEVSDSPPVFTIQDMRTLKVRVPKIRPAESPDKLDVLRKPSPYRKLGSQSRGQRYEVATNSLQEGLAMVSAMYREVGKAGDYTDCQTIALSVVQRIKSDASRVLEIVSVEVAANPDCACEIVKSAITASDADINEVVAIVEAAIHAAPDSMRIIAQCALAASPDSITGVQALLSKLDPNSGDAGHSSKSAKSPKGAKVASLVDPPENPLDRPPSGPPLPPIFPLPVTKVNP